jgi:enoyl-CoA hydratase
MGARVTYKANDSVASITMDDGKANALGFDMLGELNEALDRAEAEQAAVVLAGRDGLFTAGFDLKVMKSSGPDMPRLLKTGFELSHRMLSFPQPIVIACTGHAFAMGVFVLLSGDYRVGVAGAEHKITANEVSIGLTMPRSALEVCRLRLPRAYVDRVVVLAEVFSPDGAVTAGVLDEAVTGGTLLEAAHAKAVELKKLHPRAFAETKLRLRAGALASLRTAMDDDDAELDVLDRPPLG